MIDISNYEESTLREFNINKNTEFSFNHFRKINTPIKVSKKANWYERRDIKRYMPIVHYLEFLRFIAGFEMPLDGCYHSTVKEFMIDKYGN